MLQSARNVKTAFTLIIWSYLVFVPLSTLWSHEYCSPPVPPPRSSELVPRSRQIPGELLRNVGTPVPVSGYVGEPDGPGAIMVSGHMHAVFATPIEAFVSAATDFLAQPEFIRRLEHLEILCTDGEAYFRVHQELSFRVLGFGSDYELELHYFLSDQSSGSGEYSVLWKLAQSLDGKHTDVYGGWFFRDLVIAGRRHTYVAYKTTSVFRENQFGLRTALSRFGERDVRNVVMDLYEEAARRAP